ncbi:MAG: hypothetical protein H6842_04535 [Rhodospirillaceae bacterium]|nr:hypothetical protein [Rhodospirillaceae bacterium]
MTSATSPHRLFAAILPAVLLAILPVTARAQFADCGAAGYLGGVDDRMAGTTLSCDEAVRFTITTPRGPREVRIITDADDSSADLSGRVAGIRTGIERAAAALMSIGEGAPGNITVWAADLTAPEDAAGITDGVTHPVGRSDGECAIAVYPGADTPFAIAHEFFHCVQYATYGTRTDRSASAWWAEGSAEWFANLALPGTANSDADAGTFDAVSPDTALTAMDQEAVVFFFWLDQRFGPSMVMALMAAMPDSNSEAAQQDALAGLLAEDDFRHFAEDYLDRTIRQPGGRAIASTPFPGDIYAWSESRTHEIRADRFVLARAQAEFACGRWSIERSGEHGTWRVSRDEAPWEEMPDRLTVEDGAPARYRIAAFGTGADGFAVSIEATRDACVACAAVVAESESARCLIGTWHLEAGGYGAQIGEALRSTGLYDTVTYPDLEAVLVIGADGTYSFPGTPEETVLSTRAPSGDLHIGYGTLAHETSGTWSVDGDTLTLCESYAHVEIDLTLTSPDTPLERFRTAGGPEDMPPLRRERTFTCSDAALSLVEDIPFSPTVTWDYSRAE